MNKDLKRLLGPGSPSPDTVTIPPALVTSLNVITNSGLRSNNHSPDSYTV